MATHVQTRTLISTHTHTHTGLVLRTSILRPDIYKHTYAQEHMCNTDIVTQVLT